MANISLAERDLKHIWHPCSQMKDYEELPPIVVDRAKGVYLYDTDGKRYIDVVSSWWCNLLGHCNDRINAAVKSQIDRLEHVIFANFSHEPAITLCEKLSALTPVALNKFFFTDNGSSAIEAAMKMSFQYHIQSSIPGHSRKRRFMALSDAYHGETLGALSVGGVDLYSELYRPLLIDVVRIEAPDCYRCKYGASRETCSAECFASAEETFDRFGDETCALLVEPLLQCAAGMRIYPSLYLEKLKKICVAYGVHLIADEIATGYGRTGKMFACGHADVTPDIMCLSKGLTGGYMPMALAVTTDEIYDAFYADYSENRAFMHSHTYCGNPLACSAAVEVLNIMSDEDIIGGVAIKAPIFTAMAQSEMSGIKWVGEIRHIGLINAIELVEDSATKKPFDPKRRCGYQIYRRALSKGVLLRPLGDVMYFNPPLVMEEKDMRHALRVCAECIREVLME
ncbi:MAG: adenosylmethionine--8-amino-7-oxononanoate transaminase [Synergistaceae bacterium]|jgi:adenosylmethionine-8-amino-7-oxononanoate aminotransferase|nr:adenosylmethionine--8-amino-7-oxononanoate transaminase [Synergistaceae bacterium]